MTEQPTPPQRFKADMPQIPGVNDTLPRGGLLGKMSPTSRLVAGLLLVLLMGVVAARLFFRPRPADAPLPEPAQQIEVPTPASDLRPAPPASTESSPGISTISELAHPWASKDFFFRNRLTGENVPALVVRLPGAAAQTSSYWAFSTRVPYGNCQLEYITDLDKLRAVYGFNAKHPMVGDPCSHTVFDPLRQTSIPGGVWVRGAIAQGSAIRPPLGIEIELRGEEVLATRME